MRAERVTNMAIYNPADPWGWQQIEAERQAREAGQLPGGGTRYDLPNMSDDLEYIAYLQQDKYARDQADADTALRKTRAQDDYNQALRQLEQQGLAGRRDTDTSLLSRGVYNSGEAVRRRDDLAKALTQGREQADVTYSQNQGDIDADRQRALTQLDMQREREIAASKARIAAAQKAGREADPRFNGSGAGGSATGGGTTTTATAPRTYTLPQSPMLPSSNESGVGYSTAGARTGSTYNTSTGGGKPVGVPAFNTSRKPTPKPYSKPKVVQY